MFENQKFVTEELMLKFPLISNLRVGALFQTLARRENSTICRSLSCRMKTADK